MALERVNALEEKINDVGGEIRELEDRDNDAAQREELTEEKLKVGGCMRGTTSSPLLAQPISNQ